MWPEFVKLSRIERGWWPEHDPHQAPEKQAEMLRALCGPTGVRMIAGHTNEDYIHDVFGVRRSYAEIELGRLADLAARHNAKLILLIQP